MASSAEAAKYQLFTITKNGKVIQLQSKVVSFDYYESLLSPNITATLTYVDTGVVEKGEQNVRYDKKYDSQERVGTIYNALPITGTGDEEIKFKITSGLGTLDFSKTPLYVSGSSNPDQESNRETVVLNLVSKSAITNQQTHVKKNYFNSTTNTQSVKNIAKNILKLDKIITDESSNRYPFIGNMKSPFEVLIMLASKSAYGDGKPGFFFYETKDGHNFRAIDRLISQTPVNDKNPYFKTEVNRSSVNEDTSFKISSFSVNKNQNLINALKSGVYSSRGVFFNPKTFKEEERVFSLDELSQSLGKKQPPTPEVAPTDDDYARVMYSILDVGALSSSTESKGEANPKDWQQEVQMRYNLLFTQVVKIQVPCNPNLKAGDVIRCDLEIISPDQKVQGFSDPVESGKYLIMDLCHHYDSLRSFTSMTLVRDTYGKYGGSQ